MKAGKTPKPQIALNLPRVVALLLVLVRHVIAMMTKNASMFVNPNPDLGDVGKHADDLEAAEALAKSRAKAAVAARDDKRLIVENDLNLLKAYIIALAIGDIGQASFIIQSSGFTEKRVGQRVKPPLAALLGPNPLEVVLRALAEKKKAFYEWEYSSDGAKSWLAIGTTNKASTTFTAPTAGATYYFRYRATVKDVTGDWSQAVRLTVPAPDA